MKSNYGKLLLTIVGLIQLASLLIAVPSQAQRGLNPRPSIFNEPPYNRGTKPTETTPTTIPNPTTPPVQTTSPVQATETKNVVEVLKSDGSFKTLIQALQAAGLAETLSGKGPFTIFAPTDAAFAKLPPDALQNLLKPENKEVLVKVLNYHVVPSELRSSDWKSGQVTSLEGGVINIKVDSSGVTVNEASVTKADTRGSNGVVHAINQVILPPGL